MTRRLARAALGGALVLLVLRLSPALSATGGIEAVVSDERGKPIADAVVSLTSAAGPTPALRVTPATMDQQNKEFVPYVLVVALGTPVTFPNHDNIRHHVYSFSPSKRFELPLYIGRPAAPVVFDKLGAVVLGCNIHDWMAGYIYVLATPWFTKTAADGRARVRDLPPDTYDVRVWHPRMKSEPEKAGKPVTVAVGETGQVTFTLALKPDHRIPRREYGTPQS